MCCRKYYLDVFFLDSGQSILLPEEPVIKPCKEWNNFKLDIGAILEVVKIK